MPPCVSIMGLSVAHRSHAWLRIHGRLNNISVTHNKKHPTAICCLINKLIINPQIPAYIVNSVMTTWHVDGNLCSLSAPAQLMEEKASQIRSLLFPLTPFCPVLTPQQSCSAFAILYFLQSGSPRLLYWVPLSLPQCLWEYSAAAHSCGIPRGKCLGPYASQVTHSRDWLLRLLKTLSSAWDMSVEPFMLQKSEGEQDEDIR